jgi:hypothetical protein
MQSKNVATDLLNKSTYATIVKKHEPNQYNPVPILKLPLYPMTIKTKHNNKAKLSKTRATTNNRDRIITMTSNNIDNQILTGNNPTDMTDIGKNTIEKPSDTLQDNWTVVQLQTHQDIDKSLPTTYLEVPSPSLYDNDATYVYGVRIIITPPKHKGVSIVNPQIFISKLLSTLQYVCSNTAITVWDDTEHPSLSNPFKVLEKDNDSISHYLKTYDTNNPTFVCFVRLHTDMSLNQFKQNKDLLQWLKQENIILEKTILNGEYAEPIGFFLKRNTQEEMLQLQTTRIRESLPNDISNKCDFCNMWIRSGPSLSTKVLMVKTNINHEDKVIETIDNVFNKGMGGYFFSI